MSFISMKENQGNKTASLMKQYRTNIGPPSGAILSLNAIAHTIGSAGVGAESMKLFGEEYFGLLSALLTLLYSGTFRLIPKTIGASSWRSLAMTSLPKSSVCSSFSTILWYCFPNLLTTVLRRRPPGFRESRGGIGHGRRRYYRRHLP